MNMMVVVNKILSIILLIVGLIVSDEDKLKKIYAFENEVELVSKNNIIEVMSIKDFYFFVNDEYYILKYDKKGKELKKRQIYKKTKMSPQLINVISCSELIYLFIANGEVLIYNTNLELVRKKMISPGPSTVCFNNNKFFVHSWEPYYDNIIYVYNSNLFLENKYEVFKSQNENPYHYQFFLYSDENMRFIFLFKYLNKVELYDSDFNMISSNRIEGLLDTISYNNFEQFQVMIDKNKSHPRDLREIMYLARVPSNYIVKIGLYNMGSLLIEGSTINDNDSKRIVIYDVYGKHTFSVKIGEYETIAGIIKDSLFLYNTKKEKLSVYKIIR